MKLKEAQIQQIKTRENIQEHSELDVSSHQLLANKGYGDVKTIV